MPRSDGPAELLRGDSINYAAMKIASDAIPVNKIRGKQVMVAGTEGTVHYCGDGSGSVRLCLNEVQLLD